METPTHVFAVFDGHGGHAVSKFCADRLLRHVFHELVVESARKRVADHNIQVKDMTDALGNVFRSLDAEIRKDLGPEAADCGTTALVLLLQRGVCCVAHCGDTRAVLAVRDELYASRHRAAESTTDHKPCQPVERARIEAAGGFVLTRKNDSYSLAMGVLAMSRALGDLNLNPWISPEPDVKRWSLDGAGFIILASDGLWDVIDDQQAVDLVASVLSLDRKGSAAACSRAAQRLVDNATASGSRDNISVIVVDLSCHTE